MKNGLADLFYVFNSGDFFFESNYVKLIRFLFGILMIIQAFLAYVMRDALLLADNYALKRNLRAHDLVDEIACEFYDQIQQSNFLIPELCDKCREPTKKFEIWPSSFLKSCGKCNESIGSFQEINIKDSWLYGIR
jgi:hypothetical protein